MRVKYEGYKIALSYFLTEAFTFSFDLKSGYYHIEIFERQSFTCLQLCLLVYRLHLTFSPKLLSLWKNIGEIRAYALLFFLTMAGP